MRLERCACSIDGLACDGDEIRLRGFPVDRAMNRTYVPDVERVSRLTESRLDSLYTAGDFGGERTMRAKVIRELIDEIRALREELASRDGGDIHPGHHS